VYILQYRKRPDLVCVNLLIISKKLLKYIFVRVIEIISTSCY
jgi:hypothetical protein